MASRDITSAFLERRSAANMRRRVAAMESGGKGVGGGRFGGMKGGRKKVAANSMGDDHLLMEDDHRIEMGGNGAMVTGGAQPILMEEMTPAALPPQWVDDVDGVHEVLADVMRLMGVLASMHATRVGSVFGRDLEDMEGKIEALTRDITDRFRHAEKLLKRVGAATRRAGGEETTVGANVQRSLAKKLQELSVEFRQKQRKYLADVQAQKGVVDDSKFGILKEEDQADGGFGFTSQQQSLSVVDDLTQAVQSRDTEIAQIASSIEELGAIFKELAVLVIDQGTILDRIDYNMEAVVEHTKEGIQQLERAETHQKNSRPMKCIMCLLCTIAVLLLILILKHRHR